MRRRGSFIGASVAYRGGHGIFAMQDVFDAGPRPDATITFTDSASDTTDLSTYTFSSRAIGTASGSRLVIVALAYVYTAAADPTSVTIGGVAATKLTSQVSSNGAYYTGIYAARVSTGATADVVVSLAASAARCGIGIAAAYNVDSLIPEDTGLSTANPADLSFDATKGAVGIGIASVFAGTTWSWSGLTEGNDTNVESGAMTFSCATAEFATAGIKSITATSAATDSVRRAGCSVSLR